MRRSSRSTGSASTNTRPAPIAAPAPAAARPARGRAAPLRAGAATAVSTSAAATGTGRRRAAAAAAKPTAKSSKAEVSASAAPTRGKKRKAVEAELSDADHESIKSDALNDCVICLSKFEYPVSLQCGHTFCKCCLLDWEEMKKTNCPVCRTPIPGGVQDLVCAPDAMVFDKEQLKKETATELGLRMIRAARCGLYDRAMALVKIGACAAQADTKGRTALYWVLHTHINHRGACDACLGRLRCPCPNCEARECTCPPRTDTVKMAKFLLNVKGEKQCGGCVSATRVSDLVLAIAGKVDDVAVAILERVERKERFDLEARHMNFTALEWAVKHEKESIALQLLRLGAEISPMVTGSKVPLFLKLSAMCMKQVIDEGRAVHVRNVPDSMPDPMFQETRAPLGQRPTTRIPLAAINPNADLLGGGGPLGMFGRGGMLESDSGSDDESYNNDGPSWLFGGDRYGDDDDSYEDDDSEDYDSYGEGEEGGAPLAIEGDYSDMPDLESDDSSGSEEGASMSNFEVVD